ncbi:MAG: TatD family hydrolase [Flavobacteriales bacterium]|nr:TatD family hydrolase [Flavobacteriales bacterium]
MILTDTHTHLYLDEFKDDLDEVLQRCEEAGVSRFFLPDIHPDHTGALRSLVARDPDKFFPMTGLHPCYVDHDFEKHTDRVISDAKTGNFCAIGEIGIDLYWDKSTLDIQEKAFRKQVECAYENGLPIVIHSRESIDLILDILSTYDHRKLNGIMHCFTGTIAQANRAISLGLMLGIGGVLTFKNAGLDAVVATLELEHLVLETDSPYLAPTPHRGKRNESSYLRIIAEKLATIKETSLEVIAEITTSNSKKIFNR